jgi:NAD dependent epimerase/dehydratase
VNWAGRNVLVTGAGGFIGSHLVEELVARRAKVRCLVRYNSRGSLGWLDDVAGDVYGAIEIIQGDLRDADAILSAVRGRSVVFHLGAIISIPFSYVSPSEVAAVNITGTLNVLNACRTVGVERLIHTSTSEVYGTAQFVPIDESHPVQGQSPYSASKIGADKLAESYHLSFGLPVTTVRPFNTYGPRQSARAVIPTIMVQMLTKSAVSLGSLTPTRDFTFVTDTVAGMIRAAEAADAVGRTINLGSGQEISIGQLVEAIARISEQQIDVQVQEQRLRPKNSEVNRLLSNNGLAQSLMSWQPVISLDDGLRQTLQWLRGRLEHYRRAQNEYIV